MAQVPPYSIGAHFGGGCSVFLTGATGYIGSLVLEKLLRSTGVGRVYVLIRPRRGRAPAERLAHVLQSPLFHRLRSGAGDAAAGPAAGPIHPAVLARVVAVPGDILEPGLGLSEADAAELAAAVDTVVHSAADIRLEAHIQDTLRANYCGTLAVMALAARMTRLRAFVHVSTCYVNIDRPRGSLVDERLHPLTLAGAALDPSALASELLALPRAEAGARAAALIRYLGFRNPYALGKRLAEAAGAKAAAELGLPLSVLRPSLVSAVAHEPYPGYAGNDAGLVGATLSYIVGLYDDHFENVASDADSIWDIVPGDLVAHAVIATAAAAAEIHRLRAAAPPKAAPPAPPAAAPPAPLLVVHAATSTTYPLAASDVMNTISTFTSAHPRPWTLALRRTRLMLPGRLFDAAAFGRNQWVTRAKVRLAVGLCRFVGLARAARLLQGGYATFMTINQPHYDLHLAFSTANLCALEAALAPKERGDFLLVWRPPPPKGGAAGAAAGCEGGSSGGEGGAGAASGSSGGGSELELARSWSPASSDSRGSSAAGDQPGAAAAGAGAAGAGAWEGICWREYQHTIAAYLYHKLFKQEVPREAPVPAGRLRALRAMPPPAPRAAAGPFGEGDGREGRWDATVVHRFAAAG